MCETRIAKVKRQTSVRMHTEFKETKKKKLVEKKRGHSQIAFWVNQRIHTPVSDDVQRRVAHNVHESV